MRRTVVILIPALALLLACGERRDTAEIAAGVGPFSELRGISLTALRVGEVRAFRRGALPAPHEGLRETIGEWDVLFEVSNFVGTDGGWPAEDVQVLAIEATQAWPSDSSALAAFAASVLEIRGATGATPDCLDVSGPGYSLRVAEFDRGGGWHLTTAFSPETTLANHARVSARHGLAVRRSSMSERFPEVGAENPDDRPTWARVDCAGA